MRIARSRRFAFRMMESNPGISAVLACGYGSVRSLTVEWASVHPKGVRGWPREGGGDGDGEQRSAPDNPHQHNILQIGARRHVEHDKEAPGVHALLARADAVRVQEGRMPQLRALERGWWTMQRLNLAPWWSATGSSARRGEVMLMLPLPLLRLPPLSPPR